MATLQGVKRKNFSKACFLCQKACATCDEQQPCGRCITQGVAHMCFYSDESKKRLTSTTEPAKEPLYHSTKETRRSASNSTDEILTLILAELRDMREDQKRLHEEVRALRAQQDKVEMHLRGHNGTGHHANTSPNPNGLGHTYINGIIPNLSPPDAPNRQFHPYSVSHDHAHGTHSHGCPRCAVDEANATPSPTASTKLGNLGAHMGYPQNQNTPIVSSPPSPSPIPTPTPTTTTTSSSPSTSSSSPSFSHDPNWSALTTTGANGLNGRNGGTTVNGLADIMEQLKSGGGTRQFGLPPASEREMVAMQKTSDGAKLTLVFDLTAQPPTVISAPESFCRMMGYEMQEVMNMPWHKFIHPSNVHRTMNILNQAHMSTTIQFPQLYKTKDGHMFRTLDTHNIVYESGRPIYDIVSISLSPSTKVSSIKERRPASKSEASNAVSLIYPSPKIYSFNSPPPTPSPNISPTISAEIAPSLEEIPSNDLLYDSLNEPLVEDLNSPSPSFMSYPPSPGAIPVTPSMHLQSSCSNLPPPHPPPFTIDDPHHSPPLSSSHDFDGNINMDDDELYRILTNEV